jgi:cytidylate kinase
VIVVTGPPGAGTTTVARLLADIGGYGDHTLDSTRLTAPATGQAILRGLAEGSFRLTPRA